MNHINDETMTEIITDGLDALTQSLVLSVTASCEEKSQDALELARGFAAGLSEIQVENCKRRAEKILNFSN